MRNFHRSRLRVVGLVLAVVLVWGCNEGDKATSRDQSEATQSEGGPFNGLAYYESQARNYTIAYPEDWEVSPDYIKLGEAAGDAFISRETVDGFKPNVNIIRETVAAGTSEDEYVDAALRGVKAQLNVDPEVGSDIHVDGHTATTFSYEADTGAVRYDVSQLVFVNDGYAWIMTLSAPAGEIDDYQPTFEIMYSSFSTE